MSCVLRMLGLSALAASLAACAPVHHTIEPYRSDTIAARNLEGRAQESCASSRGAPRALPEEPFVTDGCSLWPDDGWGEPCCVQHDERYWCGGRAPERAAADAALRRCVDERASAFVAWLMWVGVRAGGHPVFPSWYRWGFGRGYLPWYGDYPVSTEPSSETQQRSP